MSDTQAKCFRCWARPRAQPIMLRQEDVLDAGKGAAVSEMAPPPAHEWVVDESGCRWCPFRTPYGADFACRAADATLEIPTGYEGVPDDCPLRTAPVLVRLKA